MVSNLNNKLKELREEKDLSLDELGRLVNIPKTSLSNYERAKRQPKRDVWDKLADFFGVSTAYIMGLSQERNVINWDEHDTKLTESHFRSIDMFEKVINLDKLEEKIELRIDEKPLSKEERKALSLFIEALRELRK